MPRRPLKAGPNVVDLRVGALTAAAVNLPAGPDRPQPQMCACARGDLRERGRSGADRINSDIYVRPDRELCNDGHIAKSALASGERRIKNTGRKRLAIARASRNYPVLMQRKSKRGKAEPRIDLRAKLYLYATSDGMQM